MQQVGAAFREAAALPEPLPTGLATLDAILPGGFLRGQIAEISGSPSCGKRAIALALCARALRDGGGAAWIDSHGGFYPLPSLEAGLPLERLLVVRVSGAKAAARAATLVLRSSGAVTVVVLDIEGRFTLPDANLARLRHMAEEGGSSVLFVTERDPAGPALSTFISLRLAIVPRHCEAAQRTKQSPGGLLRRPATAGLLAMTICVLKNKFGPVRQTAEVNCDGPNRLRVDSTL